MTAPKLAILTNKKNGEELHVDLGRPLTEEEEKIFAKLQEGLHLG